MSQFKKALLKKYLSKENEEENESGSEGQQQVGSVQKEPESTVGDETMVEEDSPNSNISLILDGKNWVLPLETQDLDKDEFHPRVTSTPLPG